MNKDIEELYIRRHSGLIAIDNISDYLTLHRSDNSIRIGFHDYSIEFKIIDGKYVGYDRDSNDEITDLSDENLLRYGDQWNTFKNRLKFNNHQK